jgi:hypothetical protein
MQEVSRRRIDTGKGAAKARIRTFDTPAVQVELSHAKI